MAKKNQELQNDTLDVKSIEQESFDAKSQDSREKSVLMLRNPNSKLNITTKYGTKKLWTLEQALLPNNFKQLKESTQNMLLNGLSSADIIEAVSKKS